MSDFLFITYFFHSSFVFVRFNTRGILFLLHIFFIFLSYLSVSIHDREELHGEKNETNLTYFH